MNAGMFFPSAAIAAYSMVLNILRFTAIPFIRFFSRRNVWDIDKRLKLPSPVRDFRQKKVVWVHASSLGEAKLLLKFCAMLHNKHEDDLYLVTATTPSGVEFLEKNLQPTFCAVGFQPLDTISMVKRVVDHYHVSRLWLLETEIWPSMLWVCRKRRIPVGIANGRIEQDSYKWYLRLRRIITKLLEPVDVVLAQSEEYAARFIELGVRKSAVHVVGNIKGHIRIKRPPKKEWLEVRRAMNIEENSFLVTAGCIHRGEGAVIRSFFSSLESMGYPCKLIVVPRYCGESAELLDEIGGNVLHLTEKSTARRWEICLIEKTGILENMYKASDAAIVGGTFVDIGGHNVWEAASYAIPVFFGPYYHKQLDSCSLLINAGVGFSVSDGRTLAECMYKVVKQEPFRFIENQQRFIESVNKTMSVVEPLLP